MLPEKCVAWGRSKNCIRELSEYGAARKAEIGPENVFDYSIGSPSIPAPDTVTDTMRELLDMDPVVLHAYTPASGLPALRKAIADDLLVRFRANIPPELIYVCCGAAAGLATCMHGLLCPGDEALTFAPFFPEYRVYAEGAGGSFAALPPAAGLQPDLDALEAALGPHSKLLIINTPNNPSGVILTEETLSRLGDILRQAQQRYGHTIYLVSDEPYRELVYDRTVPFVPDYYENTIICYSFSKSLSLPGERLGYLAVSERMEDRYTVFAALEGAARACGYINAPSFMQWVVARCIGQTSDLSVYKRNRDLLYQGLCSLGFECVYPDGAFYLFMKSPEPDAKVFSERAKKYELLLVPADDFGLGGYVRLAYCVSEDMIRRSMPAFGRLAAEYFKGKGE